MNLQLKGKVAIVTGSSRGLGLAAARSLASEGCQVTVCARGEARLQQAAREVEASGSRGEDILAVVADVSTADGVTRLVDGTLEKFGGIDILVNNVGMAAGGGLLETSEEQWQEAFDQTLFPAVRVSRLAVPHMQRRGGGAIVIKIGRAHV